MKKNNLIGKIHRYYKKYYKDTLGLPNWSEDYKWRFKEEEFAKRKISQIKSYLGDFSKKKVLDVGCGTGGFIVVASQLGAKAWGIDPDKEAIAICELKAKTFNLRSADFKIAQAEILPFANNFFDIVYCYTVLEHVDDVKKALIEMVRVAKPGGLIYIEAPNYLACFEGHYKVFWLPLFPKKLAKIYLKARRRPIKFLDTINYLTPREIGRYLKELPVIVESIKHCDLRTKGIFHYPLLFIYHLFNVDPQIELIIRKNS